MKKILFSGGGSAGHVIPNIALIDDLRQNYECAYIGTDGIERRICEQNGINFYVCPAPKLARGKIFCNLSLPFKLVSSIKEAGKIIESFAPDLVFCKGGFACVPAAVAASKRDIPVITHESDVSPGLANKFIAKKCVKVLTSFPSAAQKFSGGICTGSPIRKNIEGQNRYDAMKFFGLDMRPTILVFGGGSGSKIINDCLRRTIADICKDYNVLHICGRGNKVDCNIYGYRQIEFCNDMGKAYACADGAISRCGSNAAFELIYLKIPTLFIPLENSSSRGDQVKNAKYFENFGLCRILRERDLSPQALSDDARKIMTDEKLKTALNISNVKRGNENIIREITNTIL